MTKNTRSITRGSADVLGPPVAAVSATVLKGMEVAALPYQLRKKPPADRSMAHAAPSANSERAVSAYTSNPLTHLSDPPTEFALARDQESYQKEYDKGYLLGLEEGRRYAESELKIRAEERIQQAVKLALVDVERKGRQQLSEALDEIRTAHQLKVALLEGLLAQVSDQLKQRLQEVEDDMLVLAHEVVCRILGEQAIERESVRKHIQYSVSALSDRRVVAVHMHPDDLTLLEEDRAGLHESLKSDHVTWIATKDIELGGCILQTSAGGFDARIETQLAILRETLTQARALRAAMPNVSGSDHDATLRSVDQTRMHLPEGDS